jgi:hypothetical protein
VLIRFLPSCTAADLAASASALPPGTASRHPDAERWPGCSPEGLQHGFTHGWLLQFVNAAARDAYLVQPAHLEFINFS